MIGAMLLLACGSAPPPDSPAALLSIQAAVDFVDVPSGGSAILTVEVSAAPGATVQLQPQYRYGENVPPVITGYQATNTLSIRFRDIAKSGSVLDAAYETGLSGPGRLHDLFVSIESMTPGEYKRRGEGLEIRYGYHPSPFGECLLMRTERGLCGLAFTEPGHRESTLAGLRRGFERAQISGHAVCEITFFVKASHTNFDESGLKRLGCTADAGRT